jgi:predicted HicB family RNase H-like nuclease
MNYLLAWPETMRRDVAAAAKAQGVTLAVWVREAIRQRLEREAGK